MHSLFVAIQAITLVLTCLVFYQIRRQYLFSLEETKTHKKQADIVDRSSFSPRSEQENGHVEDLNMEDDDAHYETNCCSENACTGEGSQISESKHQAILDDYIEDFFASKPLADKNN
jgi:hypothetical protein